MSSLDVLRKENGIWKHFDTIAARPDDNLTPEGLKRLLEGFITLYEKANPQCWRGQELRIEYGEVHVSGRWNGQSIEVLL